jgi:hypothetical protein
MVGIVIKCRLGNQLFQYAFIKALAKKLNTTAFVHDKHERFILPDYFELEGYHSSLNFIKRLVFKLKGGNMFKSQQSVNIDTINDAVITKPTDDIIYNGYFQSALFFTDIVNDIEKYIQVKKKYRNQFQSKFGAIFSNNKVIAIHVRRGDYLNLNSWWADNFGSNDLTLPNDYYLHSLQMVKDWESYRIIFVSDDIPYVKSAFGHFKNADFVSDEMIIDFQVLLNADVCITSNSSFSWWAAYLNNKKNKQVICPQYWLGFKVKKEYPGHIIPDTWTQVNAG